MRKAPVQARAKHTVDCILEAAAYILAERGYAGFTTNHVAERAGVNVASLYQYFPNKEALLEELQARHAMKPDAAAEEVRKRLAHAPLREVLGFLVDGALAEHVESSAVHQVLLDALPRRARKPAQEQRRMQQLGALLLPKARQSENAEMMLFAARHALLGVVHEAVCEHPQWLKQPAFRDELVRLLESYLAPSKGRASRARS